MNYKRFIYYQGTVSMASSMIFPFYILLIRNVGDSYAQFGWAYGLFALTVALCYPLIGKYADRVGDKTFLAVYSWGMATLLLFFPLASEVWHGYILQVLMGVLGAVQRNSEKTVLALCHKRNCRHANWPLPCLDLCRRCPRRHRHRLSR
ncbi:hypothetical protein A1A1_00780 [Planococcus antarcticus DSM 14505]|uniref:Major facilitator superfamily (MFS) profile domain-containing protein n=1 Tax=Planococcus antarcticus DSM 14505 TaxID=1185653 RepID=A0AA87IPX3_9BACL|nr:hypothetical protein A1A1_00780 [Planococcus antarcticus DSM 14505]